MRRKLPFIALLLIFSIQAQETPFSFAWLSDTHIGATNASDELRAAVADINTIETISFTIVSGDIAELDIGGYLDTAKAILDGLDQPYYIIPGNHDTKWSASGTQKFIALWGDDKFNFEFGEIRFIGIHQGPLLRMGAGYIVPEDLAWLENTLSNLTNQNQRLFFVTHYPLDESVSNWYEYLDIIKQYNTQSILHGHGHANRIYNYEDVVGIMGQSSHQRRDIPGGFNIVTVQENHATFAAHATGADTQEPWYKLEFRDHTYPDTSEYKRPDFSINADYPLVKSAWKYNSGWAIASAPVTGDDAVIITDGGNNVTALNRTTGNIQWQTRLGAPIYSTPEYSEGKIVVSCTDSALYCLTAREGNPLWFYKTGAPIVASPIIHNNTVFCGSSDGKFRAINLMTGDLVWQYENVDGFVESVPLIHKNKVIFGAWDGNLYALDIQTGNLKWKWNDGRKGVLYSPAVCTPAAAGNKIYIVAPDRVMSCINARNGKTIWRSDRYQVRESIGLSEDAATVFAKTMRDTVVAYSSRSRKPNLKWAAHAGYGYDIDPSAPVEKDGTLFFGTKDGYVYALNAESGATKWIHRVSIALVNNLVPVDDKTVIATAMDGTVTCLTSEQ